MTYARGVPRVRWAQGDEDSNDAKDAIFLASSYGLIPDDWQEDILYAWLGRQKNGKWCHGRCGLAVPRQNGKNGVIEVRELFGMVILGEVILHAAHEVKTTRKAFKRLKHFFGEKANDPFAKFPELNQLVAEVRNTNGQEAIFLRDVLDDEGRFLRKGGSIEFVARSSGSGRGFTVDVLVLDEAQHLDEEELEAIRSAVSSAPLGNPQVIYAGTPPDREKGELGVVWLRIRTGAGSDPRLCWIEYGAPDGPMPDINNDELLYACNPALEIRHGNGSFGLTMDVVNDERGDLSPEGLARERYGWWGNPETIRRGVIDMDLWRGLLTKAPAPTKAQVVVDVAPDLTYTSVGLAYAHDGKTVGIVQRTEGTARAFGQVSGLSEDLASVVEIALTPTAAFLSPMLTKAGIEHKQLTNAEVGKGCVAFQEMVVNGTFRHVGQQELNDAARNAITRYVNDTQQWDRRNRLIDISSLVAVSTAAQRWVLNTAVVKKPPPPPRPVENAAPRNEMATVGF